MSQTLYNQAYDALAHMKEPDFSNRDRGEVYSAFASLFGTNGNFEADKENLAVICEEVRRRSNGSVTLEEADFVTNVKGPNSSLVLKGHGREQKVIFGPYVPPFIFVG
jgi:hypothetical protein